MSHKTTSAIKTAVTVAALLALAGQARASGFAINEFSARAMGLAGAFTAVADSPATTYFNPAGLATLDGLQIEIGVTMIAPSQTYTGNEPYTNTELTVEGPASIHWVPNLHASYRIHDMVTAGIGVTFPYGLTVEWPEEVDVGGTTRPWWGRGIIQKISLQTAFITPTVAIKIHPQVFVGAGFSIIPGAVTLEKGVTLSGSTVDDIDVKLSGDDLSFAASAGILVNVLPELLNVGIGYRSSASFVFSGNAAFTKDGSAANIPAGLRTRLTDSEVEAYLSTPHVISFGLAAFPLEELIVSLNVDLITWSTYEELEIKFIDNEELDSKEPKRWKESVAIRLGAEYRVFPKLAVRAGFIFDKTPVPTSTLGPELPDGDRYEFTVGAGYELHGFTFDVAYQYLATGDIETAEVAPLIGSYTASAHLLGLSLSYKMD